MANYQSIYTGEQIDEAVGKALSASDGGGGSVSTLVEGFVRINYYLGDLYQGSKYVPIGPSYYLDQILKQAGAFYRTTPSSVYQYVVFYYGNKYYYYEIGGLSSTGAITASCEEVYSIQVNNADYQEHSFTDGENITIVLTAPLSPGGGGSN